MDLEPYQLRQLAAVAPEDYTTDDARRDLAKLATRTEIVRPFALLIAALRSGQPIYDQAELEAELARLGRNFVELSDYPSITIAPPSLDDSQSLATRINDFAEALFPPQVDVHCSRKLKAKIVERYATALLIAARDSQGSTHEGADTLLP